MVRATTASPIPTAPARPARTQMGDVYSGPGIINERGFRMWITGQRDASPGARKWISVNLEVNAGLVSAPPDYWLAARVPETHYLVGGPVLLNVRQDDFYSWRSMDWDFNATGEIEVYVGDPDSNEFVFLLYDASEYSAADVEADRKGRNATVKSGILPLASSSEALIRQGKQVDPDGGGTDREPPSVPGTGGLRETVGDLADLAEYGTYAALIGAGLWFGWPILDAAGDELGEVLDDSSVSAEEAGDPTGENLDPKNEAVLTGE